VAGAQPRRPPARSNTGEVSPPNRIITGSTRKATASQAEAALASAAYSFIHSTYATCYCFAEKLLMEELLGEVVDFTAEIHGSRVWGSF